MADDQDVAKELKVEKVPTEKRFTDYESCWPFYLKEHSKVASFPMPTQAIAAKTELCCIQRRAHRDGAVVTCDCNCRRTRQGPYTMLEAGVSVFSVQLHCPCTTSKC